MSTAQQSQKSFTSQLKKVYAFYTGGFVTFVIVLAILEQMGLPRQTIGYVFLIATIRKLSTFEPKVAKQLEREIGVDAGIPDPYA